MAAKCTLSGDLARLELLPLLAINTMLRATSGFKLQVLSLLGHSSLVLVMAFLRIAMYLEEQSKKK